MVLPCPTYAAIHSHAIAGGTVFAICTDESFAVNSAALKLGLVEVSLGMCFPGYISLVVSYALTKGNFAQHVLRGSSLTVQEAQKCGMITSVVEEPTKLIPTIIERASAIKNVSFPAFAETKRFLQLSQIQKAATPGFADDLDQRFSQVWFSEGTQSHLKAMVEKLKKK